MTDEELRQQRDLLEAMRDLSRAMGGMRSIQTNTERSLDNLGRAADRAAEEESALTRAREQAEREEDERRNKAQRSIENAQYSATNALRYFKDAVLTANPTISSFGNSLSSAGDSAWELGKAAGGLGLVFGGLAKVATELLVAGAKQADQALAASDALAKIGAANSFSANDILNFGKKLRLTAGELTEGFVKPIQDLGPAIRILGNSTEEGIVKFTKLANTSEETRKAFRVLGISTFGEMTKVFTDYTEYLSKAGMAGEARLRTEQQLSKQAVEYTKTLYALSAITGESVEEQKKKQQAAANIYEAQVILAVKDQQRLKLKKEIDERKAKGEDTTALQKKLDDQTNEMTALTGAIAGFKNAKLSDEQIAALVIRITKGAIKSGAAGADVTGQTAVIEKLAADIRAGRLKGAEGEGEATARAQDLVVAMQKSGLEVFGEALPYAKEFGEQIGMTSDSLNANAAARASDTTQLEAYRKALGKVNDVFKGVGKAAEDSAQNTRNFIQEATQDFKLGLQEVIKFFNPFTNGLTVATVGVVALGAAAAGAAALMAGAQFRNALGALGRGPGGPTPTPGAPIPPGGPPPGRPSLGSARKLPTIGAGVVAGAISGVQYLSTASDVDKDVKAGKLNEQEGAEIKKKAGYQAVGQTAGAVIGTGLGVALATGVTGLTGGAGAVAAPAIIAGSELLGGWLGASVGGAIGARYGETDSEDYDDLITEKYEELQKAIKDKDEKKQKESAKQLDDIFNAAYKRDDIKLSPNSAAIYNKLIEDKGPPWPEEKTNIPEAKDVGGPIRSGELAIVGEYGPEFVQGPASVTSRKQTNDIMQEAMKNQFADLQKFMGTSPMLGMTSAQLKLQKQEELDNLTQTNESTLLLNDGLVTILKTFYKFDDVVKELVGNEDIGTGLYGLLPDSLPTGGSGGGTAGGGIGGFFNRMRNFFRGGGTKVGPTDIKSSVESESGKKAYEFFKSKGYTDAQAAGLVANLMQESGSNLRTDAIGDGGEAYGIAQWHPDRQAEFAKTYGKDIRGSTLEEQLEFVVHELRNKEAKAGASIASVNDPELVAAITDAEYERSSGAQRGARMQRARAIYEARTTQPSVLPTEPKESAPTAEEIAEKMREKKSEETEKTTASAEIAPTPSLSLESQQLMNLNAEMMNDLSVKLTAMISRLDDANDYLKRIKQQTA